MKIKVNCKKFTKESMYEILIYLKNILKEQDSVLIEVINPSLGIGYYSGEEILIDNRYIYRSYKSWSDLAELLFCNLIVEKIDKLTVTLKFISLNKDKSFHQNKKDNKSEQYGVKSTFFRINKLEEPSFIYFFQQALENIRIENKKRILNLGINKADEFEIIRSMLGTQRFDKIKFVGIDYSRSVIDFAKKRFPKSNVSFLKEDINDLDKLNLNKFDTIISIGTLQSSSLNFKVLFMSLIQKYLDEKGSLILGFPNCRWIDGQMIYGAKAPNYSYSEQSILFKDVNFCKKYLQQKKFRVTLTGKNYLFLSATSIKA